MADDIIFVTPPDEPSVDPLALAYGTGSGKDNRGYRVERGNVYYRAGVPVKALAKFKGQAMYSKVATSALSSSGSVDLTTTGVGSKGSTPKTQASPNFTFTANSPTQLVISWLAYANLRADGTAVQLTATPAMAAIPNAPYVQGVIQADGLVGGTLYYFHPYWSESAQRIGFVRGGVGTPAIAFTVINYLNVQTQNLSNNFSLGVLQFTMPAAGTSTGTTGGGLGSASGTKNAPSSGTGARVNLT